jgi:hypothetical protein
MMHGPMNIRFTHVSYIGGKASDCSYLGYSKFLKNTYETPEVTNYNKTKEILAEWVNF